jgi:predicted nucleic acid-binding protein
MTARLFGDQMTTISESLGYGIGVVPGAHFVLEDLRKNIVLLRRVDDGPLCLLVLDANILVRAVLGRRVRGLLAQYGARVDFFAPDAVFAEAREHLPSILERRKVPVAPALQFLESLGGLIQIVERETYGGFEAAAQLRLRGRDLDDWPILATALALRCPIWTEDTDFFGCGVATWTTDRVELYLIDAFV